MVSFGDFSSRLGPLLEHLIGTKADEVLKTRVNSIVMELFKGIWSEKQIVLAPFSGAQILGGKLEFESEGCDTFIRWKTDFYPRSQFARQLGDCAPLGTHNGHDLYVGYQNPLPPTLIARYGNHPSEYLTCNPSFAPVIDPLFDEALRRAQSLFLMR